LCSQPTQFTISSRGAKSHRRNTLQTRPSFTTCGKEKPEVGRCISAVSSSVAVNSITDGEFKDELALAAVLDLVHTGMVQVLVLRFLMNQSCLQSHDS